MEHGYNFETKIKLKQYQHLLFLIEFKINKHILISDSQSKCLHVLDSNSLSYIKMLEFENHVITVAGICEITNKQQICIVEQYQKHNKEVELF